jgi:hypothetical protein
MTETVETYAADWDAGVLAANDFAAAHTPAQVRNELARARSNNQRYADQPANGTRDGYTVQLLNHVEAQGAAR